VDAAVVVGGVHVGGHVAHLGILSERGVVVRGAGVGHVAQGPRPDPRQEDALPDQPVGLRRGLAQQPLLETHREAVGHRLVEGAGLPLVGQRGSELGDGVRELVAEHVDRLGERPEHLSVTVAEDQLLAVPEGVVVVLLVVDGHDRLGSLAVVRRAPEDVAVHRECRGDAVGGLVDRGVSRGRLAGLPDDVAGQRGPVLGGVDDPGGAVGRRLGPRRRGRRAQTALSEPGVAGEGEPAVVGRLRGRGGDALEEIRRDEGAGSETHALFLRRRADDAKDAGLAGDRAGRPVGSSRSGARGP
jgi:hypothetical protein